MTKACKNIPGTVMLAGAIAAYAGTDMDAGDMCAAVAGAVSAGSLWAIAQTQYYRALRYDESDFQDCNPSQNTMAKVYCDLSCVEDAVKRGDQRILSSIGTLNRNILSEMREFFQHYVSEIFTRLTHMEDKQSHESSQLKNVMDTYAQADLNAVNSNGKQIIDAMNSQHSALNKNLGIAAKQIFDLTHEDALSCERSAGFSHEETQEREHSCTGAQSHRSEDGALLTVVSLPQTSVDVGS